MRKAVGLGDAEVGEQEGRKDSSLLARVSDPLFGQAGGLPIVNHATSNETTDDSKDAPLSCGRKRITTSRIKQRVVAAKKPGDFVLSGTVMRILYQKAPSPPLLWWGRLAHFRSVFQDKAYYFQ